MKGVNFSNKNSFKTDLLQFGSAEEAIFRTHVVVSNAEGNMKLTLADMKEAELDWTLLHHDIHLGSNISKQLLRSKQALMWKFVENVQWISQALMVATHLAYKPSIPFPNFRGKD
ncbi:unnamed protein product [Allacma fusca]|uniref:Uncharacterized protein n=1 Tax=Allacma fusca TaxID=39272 RepID=A0A8J2PBD0_9HEXA|nr:unnamed protein product [Allacma fusca]